MIVLDTTVDLEVEEINVELEVVMMLLLRVEEETIVEERMMDEDEIGHTVLVNFPLRMVLIHVP